MDATPQHGPLAPLRHRTFLWFWLAFVAATMGTSMQTLGAQWYLVERDAPDALVALVQGAVALPMAVLALPAGALADLLPRRALMATVQSAGVLVGGCAALATWTGSAGPETVLPLVLLLGAVYALVLTPFQALISDVVPHGQVPASAALVSIAANISRVLGPAVAGFLVARSGVPTVLAVSTVGSACFVLATLRWDGGPPPSSDRERVWAATVGGLRYARHSPQMLRLMLRSFWFTAAMMSLFALLPLVADEQLGLGADGYGLLFAALGGGAIVGGLTAGVVRRHLTQNATVATAFLLCAVVVGLLPTCSSPVVAAGLVVAGGWGWTTCLSTMAGAIQVYLPAWVRARGLAIYSCALFGGQAGGALVLGQVAGAASLTVALWVAAAALLCGIPLARWLPLVELDGLDRRPARYWPEPSPEVAADDLHGEVVVTVTYSVTASNQEAFHQAMSRVRRVRLRTGATGWRLLRDIETRGRYVEEFVVPSWAEHTRQRSTRLVESDRHTEERAAQLCDATPVVTRHLRIQHAPYRPDPGALDHTGARTASAPRDTRGDR